MVKFSAFATSYFPKNLRSQIEDRVFQGKVESASPQTDGATLKDQQSAVKDRELR
jgi:hypothetical protein